jgi:hypothetical protein
MGCYNDVAEQSQWQGIVEGGGGGSSEGENRGAWATPGDRGPGGEKENGPGPRKQSRF